MEKETVLNQNVYEFSKKAHIIQTILIGLIAFLVPTFLAQCIRAIFGAQSIITANSQIIVGSVVNAALIMAAINLKGWKEIVGVVTMPSISTILGGYVLGTASVYMVYMIPAIWLGNFVLVYSYKLWMLQKEKNYFLAGILGIVIKVAIIFGCFEVLNAFQVFPSKLVENLQTAMGMTQFITAGIGTLIAFAIYQIEKKKQRK